MISARQLERIESLVGSRSSGSELATGGNRVDRDGFFFEPTVIAGPADDDAAVREEIFGPVVTVQRVSGEADLLASANGTPYGLGASVWTRDGARALRAANALDCGTVAQ